MSRHVEHIRSDAERLLDGMIRFGRVHSVSAKHHTARVHFEDDGDDGVSHDLPVLVNRPGDYWLPAPQSLVACLFLPGNTGDGVVLGAFYSEADAPPLENAGQRSIASDDLRLGAADASDFVALASLVKGELDAIKSEFSTIKATLDSLAGQAAFGVPYAVVGYSPSDVSAEKVKAK